MNLKKILSAVSATSVFAVAVLPVAASSTTLVVEGNGTGTSNFMNVTQTNSNTTTQSNNAVVVNNVKSESTSGENSASYNTGGETNVVGGNAKSTVSVLNDLNTNVATTDCCDTNDVTAKIDGNGAYSQNTLELGLANTVKVTQDNLAKVYNNVDAKSVSGNNDAKLNTGGQTVVAGGNAESAATVATLANTNVAVVTPSNNGGTDVSVSVTNNGSASVNWADISVKKSVSVDQDNDALVKNNVDSEAKSGYNDAGFNTGGPVVVASGDAMATAALLNDVNSNFANVDCGCATNLMAKIANNGAGETLPYTDSVAFWPWYKNYVPASQNTIFANLVSSKKLGQLNDAYMFNEVDAEALSGKNDATANTVGDDEDPAVVSGDSVSNTEVVNKANTNVSGEFVWPFDMPEFDHDVEFEMNFEALLAAIKVVFASN